MKVIHAVKIVKVVEMVQVANMSQMALVKKVAKVSEVVQMLTCCSSCPRVCVDQVVEQVPLAPLLESEGHGVGVVLGPGPGALRGPRVRVTGDGLRREDGDGGHVHDGVPHEGDVVPEHGLVHLRGGDGAEIVLPLVPWGSPWSWHPLPRHPLALVEIILILVDFISFIID